MTWHSQDSSIPGADPGSEPTVSGPPPVDRSEEDLRRDLLKHIESIGLDLQKSGDGNAVESKDRIRSQHRSHRFEAADRERKVYDRSGADLLRHFATGSDIDPRAIDPQIVEVKKETEESELFRVATLLWSVPVSRGYGRRMRFIIRDRQNGKLVGLLAIGSPVFNLHARDEWIGWSAEDRRDRLTSVMDAYVAGAVPPYSQLIGGKVVCSLWHRPRSVQASGGATEVGGG